MYIINHNGQPMRDDFGNIRKFDSVGYAIEFLHQKERVMNYFSAGDFVNVYTESDLAGDGTPSYIIEKL